MDCRSSRFKKSPDLLNARQVSGFFIHHPCSPDCLIATSYTATNDPLVINPMPSYLVPIRLKSWLPVAPGTQGF
jgi:hypothetical protein